VGAVLPCRYRPQRSLGRLGHRPIPCAQLQCGSFCGTWRRRPTAPPQPAVERPHKPRLRFLYAPCQGGRSFRSAGSPRAQAQQGTSLDHRRRPPVTFAATYGTHAAVSGRVVRWPKRSQSVACSGTMASACHSSTAGDASAHPPACVKIRSPTVSVSPPQ
jgi:hypothetical protein